MNTDGNTNGGKMLEKACSAARRYLEDRHQMRFMATWHDLDGNPLGIVMKDGVDLVFCEVQVRFGSVPSECDSDSYRNMLEQAAIKFLGECCQDMTDLRIRFDNVSLGALDDGKSALLCYHKNALGD